MVEILWLSYVTFVMKGLMMMVVYLVQNGLLMMDDGNSLQAKKMLW